MAEHWKSTPKYWCKHCGIYVKDTNFERKQHESTGKHQGNLKRFLQGIQKDHQQNEREKERTKAEVERLNRITGAAAPSDGASPAVASSSLKSTKSTSTSLSAADQKRQWAQLAEMGIAIPEHARAEMAMVGDWQTIARKPVLESEQSTDDKLNIGVRKRKFEGDEDPEAVEETVIRKGWGSATRRYPGKEDQIDEDLDTLIAQSITKPLHKTTGSASETKVENDETRVKREESADKPTPTLDEDSKLFAGTTSDSLTPYSEVKLETDESNLGSVVEPKPVFKKRKPKPQPGPQLA